VALFLPPSLLYSPVDRFKQFPAALASQTRTAHLGSIPALLAHPDWNTPAPVVIWLHGRTANKELDPGRYLRWIRAGIAACAIDLPGHGERLDPAMQTPERSLDLIEQGLAEVDRIVDSLSNSDWSQALDLNRLALGGMSAGGMITLRRLCNPHPFRCAAVEATTGNLADLYHPTSGRKWSVDHPTNRVAALDPMQHLPTFTPLPLLALHSETDELIPVQGQREFIESLRAHYCQAGADPALIEWTTWPSTGAPQEHIGFGRVSNDAKNAQTAFLRKWLIDEA
jgi:alpha-beta hydrolase superfamily lysophospholipase